MADEFPVVIFHNPDCGTSRNALAMIQAAGYEPSVVEYLQTGWTRGQLCSLAAAMGVEVRALIREKGTRAAALGLLAADITEEAILDAMVAEPILVNRPIVVTPRGTKLCRPSEQVLELIERTQR
jgi:arsenate reductase